MTRELINEDDAAAEIVERLSARFPNASAADVVAPVADARRSFERATVRDFVPVLVEREAKARLERPI